jgi:Lrp/AsnC family transcriptional regulator, leucine-responsive regulatory protein
VDNIDVKILKLLQFNARMTVSEMAAKINLSIPAVSERLKKLESSGIIEQYTAILNAKKLNKSLTVIVFITLESSKYTDKFNQFVNAEDEIVECYYLAGDFDYVLKIITDNTLTLENILNKIKGVSGIQKTRTIVTLSNIKNKHSITLNETK